MARTASLYRCINAIGRSHGVPVLSGIGSHRSNRMNETVSAKCHPGKPQLLLCETGTRDLTPMVQQCTVGGLSILQSESGLQGSPPAAHSTAYFFTLCRKMVNARPLRQLCRLWTVWRGMMEQGR